MDRIFLFLLFIPTILLADGDCTSNNSSGFKDPVVFFTLRTDSYNINLCTEESSIDEFSVVYGYISLILEEAGNEILQKKLFMKTTYEPFFSSKRYFAFVVFNPETVTSEIAVVDYYQKKISTFDTRIRYISSIVINNNLLYFTTENYENNLRTIDMDNETYSEIDIADDYGASVLYWDQSTIYVSYYVGSTYYGVINGLEVTDIKRHKSPLPFTTNERIIDYFSVK